MPKQDLKVKQEHYSVGIELFSKALQEKGEDGLEVVIAERIANGDKINKICKELEIKSVHVVAWLKDKHPEILNAANYIAKDDMLSTVVGEADRYDEENYKYLQAKHKALLNVAAQTGDVHKDQKVGGGGTTFALKMVFPKYADQEDVEKIVEINPMDSE